MTDAEKSDLIQEIADALWAAEAITGPIDAMKALHELLKRAHDAYIADHPGVRPASGGTPK